MLSGENRGTTEIAERLGCGRAKVLRWQERYLKGGLEGLVEKPRSGRPPRITSLERHEVVSMACRLPPDFGVERSHWSLDSLRTAVLESGRVQSIGTTSIWNILNKVDLRPQSFRMWMFSRDPHFDTKMRDIVDLYTVRALQGETVLSIDEKTSIQALERKYPIVAPAPGYSGLFESEYIRHGTTCLFACFNVGTGKVLGWCNATRKQPDYLRFLDMVADTYPSGAVHLIADNLNTHVSQAVRDWNTRQGSRFQLHFTPTHASWMNQVEIWFSLLQKERLRHGSFQSVPALVGTLMRYIEEWNEKRAHPFKWTWKGYPLHRGTPPVARWVRQRKTSSDDPSPEAKHATEGRAPAGPPEPTLIDAGIAHP
ncbi:MAG: IS630 family transposase [Deltaproteobacteria bacterium]|nr:IS630 family transposase [Deltaproteobacteria bacterium]